MKQIGAICVGLAISGLAGCATAPPYSIASVSDALEERAGMGLPGNQGPLTPPGVNFADGISEREAVALALWNSPSFRANLADLGVAEADLFDMRRPANPTLSLLDPVGPGILEGAITVPINLLRRPARINAARLKLDKLTHDLVQNGLGLARDVRHQYASLTLANVTAGLLNEDAEAMEALAKIIEQQAKVGRSAELDAAAARTAALERRSDADFAKSKAAAALSKLSSLTGVDLDANAIDPRTLAAAPSRLPAIKDLEQIALTTRPDLVAANLAVEAAEKERGGAALDLLQPVGIVDLGQENGESLKVSGGGSVNIPIFNQGQGARNRAQAALDRAIAERDALRMRINEELTTAHGTFEAASSALAHFDDDIVPANDQLLKLTQQSHDLGRASPSDLIRAQRVYIATKIKRAKAASALQRAYADINYSVGRELFIATPESKK